jgi:regulator of replication initiation timing
MSHLLKVQIEELRTQISELTSELENYKYENQSLTKRLEDNEEIRTRLEVEALQMADELDVAR